MNNVKSFDDCFGCGVCALACGKKIIEITLGEDGFYAPNIIDETQCVNCGMCVEVCSFYNRELPVKPQLVSSYAAWSNDNKIRESSSSGGVVVEISKALLNEGYKVCSVKFDVDLNRAEHYIANNVREIIPSIGSKYLQSYTVDGFRKLNKNDKYLVIGTPCQIESLRRLIKKRRCEENYVLIDFFCHGVPSKLLWDAYVGEIEAEVGKLKSVSWRNKRANLHNCDASAKHSPIGGWHGSYCMMFEGEDKEYISRYSDGNPFYKLFLGNSCLNKACYTHCKFKYDQSCADIRVGDAWGELYRRNDDGVSIIATFSLKGESIVQKANCELIKHPFSDIASGQMKKLPKIPRSYFFVMKHLKNHSMKTKTIANIAFLIDFDRKIVKELKWLKKKIIRRCKG